MQINETGKQYLTTQRLNTKIAAYMQTEKQNKQAMPTSKSNTKQTGLCRPESRLSSSTLRRYPLVSRSETPAGLQNNPKPRPVSRCRTPGRSADLGQSRIQTPQPASQEEIQSSNVQPDIFLHGKTILFPRSLIILRSATPDVDRKPRPSQLRSQSPDTGIREPLYNLPTSGRAMIVKQLIEPLDARRRVMLLPRKPPDLPDAQLPDSAAAALDSGPKTPAAERAGGGGCCGGDSEALSVRNVVVRVMPPRRAAGAPPQPAVPPAHEDSD
jgi:hypothetical protein